MTMGTIPRSAGYIQPGDVILFRYRKNIIDLVGALIVSTKTSRGVKNANTGNKLITCFKLPEGAGEVVIKEIFKKLYKNRAKCEFKEASKVFAGVGALLGANQFRTYILGHAWDMYELRIDTDDLEAEDEMGPEDLMEEEL